MTAAPRITGETVFENSAWRDARPTVSILIPYLRDDPGRLLVALNREGPALNGAVEIILLDDGSDTPVLAAEVSDAVASAALPARLIVLAENLGRAAGRNRLAAEARGAWLLFLDSDMLPDGQDFLSVYLSLIERSAPEVAFGGFSLKHAPVRPEFALHRYMASRSDCTPVAERRRQPEKHVFTSNLLVRRDVFEEERFDGQFSGWGWEDVEWAMRVLSRHPILHIENTVTHLGLDPASVLVAKFEQSAANFARVVARHREIVASYPSYRAALLLKPLPLKGIWRPMLRALGLTEGAPLQLRDLALRLYRAALYADVV